jgi:hypothetical protein
MYTGFNFDKTELFLMSGIDRALGEVPVGQISCGKLKLVAALS